MANENESKFRSMFDKELADAVNHIRNKHYPDNDTTNDENQRPSTADTASEETDDERTAREAEERAAELAEIDETEISDTHNSTALYRRAISDFDPKETEVQLAEHWHEDDDELQRYGYF